jgi:hypothetical protein
MVVGKTIRNQVKKLTENKKTEEEKIAAVFDWVVRSTRYVGLEFGIHGFKPYRTTEVISRGFGDCKDKATLLYVMLKEAGIDAAIALVRTRSSGCVNPSFPFQFYFDHAIAAVPSRGLFLDGTVNYLDYKTLPPADQGVFSLIVADGKVETRETPMLPPKENMQQLEITMTVEEDGNTGIDGQVFAAGIITSHYRSAYQTTGTRKERLENELSHIFPGVALHSQSFEGLDAFDEDVKIDFTATVPGLAMVSGKELQLTALPSYNLYSKYASRSQRKYPVVLGHRRVYIDKYTYLAPEGWAFTALPKTVSIGGQEEGYSFIFVVNPAEPSKLEIEAILEIGSFRIDPGAYDAFREFCRKVDEATSQRIHIEKVLP